MSSAIAKRAHRNAALWVLAVLIVSLAAPPSLAVTDLEEVEVKYQQDGAGGAGGLTSLTIDVSGVSRTFDPIVVKGVRPKDDDETAPPPSVLVQDFDADTKSRCPEGNPIFPATGNKVEPELDFASAGEMGLRLARAYNHHWQGVGLFGKHWISSFDYFLTFGSTAINSCFPRPGGGACSIGANTVIYAWRPGGSTVKFVKAADGVFYEDKPSPVAKIVPNGTWFTLYGWDNEVETYGSTGRVRSIRNEQGIGWDWTYSDTYPTRITHISGRYVEFTWTNGQLTAVRDPAGAYYGYAYTANQFGTGLHRLSATSQPGTPTTSIAYHYENADPSALTGKSFNGVRFSTFGYNTYGYATLSQHGSYERYTFVYTPGADGLLTVAETNPLGKKTTYTFENGKPRTITGQPSTYCPTTSYGEITYDANGYPQLKSDFNGNDTAYTYNAKGQLTQKIEAYGTTVARKTTHVWDAAENRITSTTVGGTAAGSELLRVSYTYAADNRLAAVTSTNLSANGITNQSRTTTYTYTKHPNGMLATVTVDGPIAGAGDVVVTSYDAEGDLVSIANGLGHATAYSGHNGLGLPTRVTSVNGAITDFTYDARGRVTKVRTYYNGVAADTLYAYNGNGDLTSITTPDGVVTNVEYDSGRRLSRKFVNSTGILAGDGTQEEQRYSYNLASDLLSAANYATEGHYETQYRFTCLQPRGAPENECYEPEYIEEQVWEVSPVLKHIGYTDYDELSRPRAIRGATTNAQNVRYTYDNNGNIKTVTDSLGRVTTLTYDALDRLVQSVDPLSGITKFEYNVAGQLTKVTDPRSKITAYIRDGFGQVWAQSSPDSGTTSFEYNVAGLQTKMTRADDTVTDYIYDTLGRLKTVTSGGQSWTYTYDTCTNGKSSLCQQQDPSGGKTVFTYTPQGQLATRADTIVGNSVTTLHTTYYYYDNYGRLNAITYPNGVAVGYGYAYGKLKTMTVNIGGTVSNVITDTRYRPYGAAVKWTYGNGLTRALSYDLDSRISALFTLNGTTGLQSLNYTYDKNNQITKITNGVNSSLTQDHTYDELGRLRTVVATNANQDFLYDGNGNRTSHTWGGQVDLYSVSGTSNRLSAITGPRPKTFTFNANGNMTANAGVTYTYDSFNQLKTATKAGVTTTYVVNAQGQRIFKQASHGNYRYIYAGQNTLLSEYKDNTAVWTNYLWFDGQLVGLVRGTTLTYVHTDHLGRPELATNTAKAAVWKASNYAFGRTVTQDSIGGLNLGFPGQYYDSETGNWHNGFRDYDSSIGGYLQTDPIGLMSGLNTYAYVGGNPVSFVDPLGLRKVSVDIFPIGVGGGIDVYFDYDSKNGFTFNGLGVRGGVGEGAGISYDPYGQRPDKNAIDPCEDRNANWSVGLYGSANIGIPAINVGGDVHGGVRTNTPAPGTPLARPYGDISLPSINFGLDGKQHFGATYSAGIEWTGF